MEVPAGVAENQNEPELAGLLNCSHFAYWFRWKNCATTEASPDDHDSTALSRLKKLLTLYASAWNL